MKKILLEIKSLSKTYFSKRKVVKEALKDISFNIFEGEVLGLLGVNGAGKTTLSTLLASLHPPTSGDIIWRNKSIYTDVITYRKIIGFCPQKPNLDKTLTLEQNLFFAGSYYGLSSQKIKKKIEELAAKLSLESHMKFSIESLSGGYKQRFLVARTLMHSPKLVILDEPTVGLDPQIRRQLWEIIGLLKKDGITVLLTSHYLDEAETLSDRVCFIHDGMVHTIDTPKNLKEKYVKQTLEDVFLQFLDNSESQLFSTEEE